VAAAAAGRYGGFTTAAAPLASTKWWSSQSEDNEVRSRNEFDISFAVAKWPMKPPWPLDEGPPAARLPPPCYYYYYYYYYYCDGRTQCRGHVP